MTREHALLPLADAEDFLQKEKSAEEDGKGGAGDDATADATGNNRGVYCKVSVAF